MSYHSPCYACSAGNHDHHDGTWSGTPGLIGGQSCMCTGDCAPGVNPLLAESAALDSPTDGEVRA